MKKSECLLSPTFSPGYQTSLACWLSHCTLNSGFSHCYGRTYLFITKDVDSGETIEQDVEVGQHLGVGQPRQQPCGAQQQGENDHVPDVSEISFKSIKKRTIVVMRGRM